jgi:hypothetical protein
MSEGEKAELGEEGIKGLMIGEGHKGEEVFP